MRSMLLSSYGGALAMVELPKPVFSNDEVLIKVLVTSLNFADTLLISGKYQEKPKLPFAPGMEVCGIVERCGKNVTRFYEGQRVVAYVGHGGLTEFITIHQELCFSIPDNIPDEKAACLLIAYGSTELALNYKAKLKKKETLLVLGASGGVGLSAVQIGKAMGAFVVAVARGSKKCSIVKTFGADIVLDSDTSNLKKELSKLKSLDVVYDPVGGSQFNEVLSAARPETRILPIGFASGQIPNIPANLILVKNVTLIGFQIAAYKAFKPKVLKECFKRLIEMCSKSIVNPHVTNIYSLEKSNEAIDLIRNRLSRGKVVVSMSY